MRRPGADGGVRGCHGRNAGIHRSQSAQQADAVVAEQRRRAGIEQDSVGFEGASWNYPSIPAHGESNGGVWGYCYMPSGATIEPTGERG